MPNQLSKLALLQLERLEQFNNKREHFARFYADAFKNTPIHFPKRVIGLSVLRFPIIIPKRDWIYSKLRSHQIYLGKWYSEIIDPKGVQLETFGYKKGMCPNAEIYSKKILNLPTYPNLQMKDAEKIVALLIEYDTRI